MVVNAMDWKKVELKNVTRVRVGSNQVRVYPSNNTVVLPGKLIQDAGWTEERVRVCLYRSGNIFMFKPDKAGSVVFKAKYKRDKNGNKLRNGSSLVACGFDLRSTLCMVADGNSRFAKYVEYEAWTDGDSIVFKYKETVYADSVDKAVNE